MYEHMKNVKSTAQLKVPSTTRLRTRYTFQPADRKSVKCGQKRTSRTYLEGPASVDEAVGTLEVSVRVDSGRVQVVHALGHVAHEAELERVVQLETLVFQHVLTAQ